MKKDTYWCINLCLYHHVSTCTWTAVTMAKIQFLTILLAVTCFLGGVVSVTDKEFQVGVVFCAWNLLKLLSFDVLDLGKITYTQSYITHVWRIPSRTSHSVPGYYVNRVLIMQLRQLKEDIRVMNFICTDDCWIHKFFDHKHISKATGW